MATNKTEVMKVVEAHDVETYSMLGWRLVEVLPETYVDAFSESVPMLLPGQNFVTNNFATKGFLVSKNRFLMATNGSSILAGMNEKLADAEKRIAEAKAVQQEAEKKAEEWKKEANNLMRGHETYVRENKILVEKLDRSEKSNHKMEEDIGKIRSAVGDLKMKEILAS
jgi:hypothetical protein